MTKNNKNTNKNTKKPVIMSSEEISQLQGRMALNPYHFHSFSLMTPKKNKKSPALYAMQNGKLVNKEEIFEDFIKKRIKKGEIEDAENYNWQNPSDNVPQFSNKNDFAWVMSLLPPFLPVPVCEELMKQPMINMINSLIPEEIYGNIGVEYYCTDPNKENNEEIIKELKLLNEIRHKRNPLKNNTSINDLMLQCSIYMQSVGGALLYCKTKNDLDYVDETDQEMMLPLLNDKYSIPKNSIDGFIFVDPLYYTTLIATQYAYPLDWGFYQSEFVNSNGKNAHESRFLRFRNNLKPLSTQYLAERNWNYQSNTELIILALLAYYDRNTVTTSVMNRKNLMVQKLPSISTTEEMQDKLREFNETRDNFHGIIIDDEKGEIILLDYNMTDFAPLEKQQLEYIAVALNYTITKVLGTSPGGMGSKGNFEENSWYSKVRSFFNINLRPLEKDLLEKIQLNEFEDIKSYINVRLKPLDNLSAEDKLKLAQAFNTLAQDAVDKGVIDPQNYLTALKHSFPDFFSVIPHQVSKDAISINDPETNEKAIDSTKNYAKKY